MKRWTGRLNLVNLMWKVLVLGIAAVVAVFIVSFLRYDDSDRVLAAAFGLEVARIEQVVNQSVNTRKVPLPCREGIWKGQDGWVFSCNIAFPPDEPYGLYQVTLATQERSPVDRGVYRYSFFVKKPE